MICPTTIKQVKVYNIDSDQGGVTNEGYSQFAGFVTNSGIEGNYTLVAR
ncbi:MAG TPA: hypothetical protein VG675_19950 [Bryobacteraceae bacterium]|nr:hypothetical protein [Bryobacteraceae bacterium]